MAGNVWEWTADRYVDRRDDLTQACCGPQEPRTTPSHVVKGGSFLCADSYCRRFRPAARRPQPTDTGMSHIGFRCVDRSLGTHQGRPAQRGPACHGFSGVAGTRASLMS